MALGFVTISSWAGPLGKALSGAAEKNAAFGSARLAAENAEDRLRAARASVFLPTLDLDSLHGFQGARPDDGAGPWRSSLELRLSQNFYDNGQAWTELANSRRRSERAAIDRDLAREDFAFRVWRAWIAWRLAESRLRIQRTQRDLVDRQFRQLQDQYRQGFKTRRDFLRIDAELKRSDLDLRASEDALALARAELGVLGLDELEGLALPLEGMIERDLVVPSDVATLPELRRLALDEEIARAAASQAKRSLWPRLSLEGTTAYGLYGYLGNAAPIADLDRWTWSLGLGARWTLFDGGRLASGADIAAREWERGRLARVEAERLHAARLETLARDQARVRAAIGVREQIRRIETEGFAVVQADYVEGKVDYLNLVQALGARIAAETAFEEAVKNYLELQGEARRYGGGLYAWMLEK